MHSRGKCLDFVLAGSGQEISSRCMDIVSLVSVQSLFSGAYRLYILQAYRIESCVDKSESKSVAMRRTNGPACVEGA